MEVTLFPSEPWQTGAEQMWSHFISDCRVLWKTLLKGLEPSRAWSSCCGWLQGQHNCCCCLWQCFSTAGDWTDSHSPFPVRTTELEVVFPWKCLCWWFSFHPVLMLLQRWHLRRQHTVEKRDSEDSALVPEQWPNFGRKEGATCHLSSTKQSFAGSSFPTSL